MERLVAKRKKREEARKGAEERPTAGRILVERDRAILVVRDREAVSVAVIAALGCAFAIVGLVDLALLWWPIRLGNAAWEFGTISQTLDSIPLSGLGFGLLVFGIARHPRTSPGVLRGAAVLFGLATVAMLALGLLYVTSVPMVLKQTPQVVGGLRVAMTKSVAQILVYSVAFAFIAITLWRGVKRAG